MNNSLVSTNGGTVQVQGTISANQQNIPADAYDTTVFINVTYSAKNCLTTPISPILAASLEAEAIVPNSCVVTTNPLLFGSSGILQGVLTGQTTIAVRCNYSTQYTVALGGGNSNSTDPEQRKMTLNSGAGGTNTITYGLYYQDQYGKMIPWGSSPGRKGYTSTGFPDITVFGRVPKQPTPPFGTYSDTILVTISF